jgi:outer membrane protein
MKKTQLIINLILIAGLLGLGTYQLLKKERTVYVDIGKLMQEYQGMKDAHSDIDKKKAQYQASSDTLLKEWEGELKAYERERKNMSSKEKQLKEELLRNKQQQLSGYTESIQKKAAEEEKKITQAVVNRINEYMNDYGKRKGYTFILGANGSGNIVYADKSRDITEEILNGLQKEYEKEKK